MSTTLTIHDIARLAGVSAMTVSRALNQPERVSPATLAKVQAVVRQTGFVPNGLAGGLRSSRARLVAAVLPTLVGPVFQDMVRALSEALAGHGYQLMLGQAGYGDAAAEDALLDAILRRKPDGLVLAGLLQSAAGRRQLLASRLPVVETWDLTPTPIDMLVGFSHEAIGAAVCQHLHDRGCHRPALLGGDDARARRRQHGFLQQAARLGLPADALPRATTPPPTTLAAGRQGLAQLLSQGAGFDAVVCSSDMLALGVLIEAQARGLAVPRQLAVVGLGDLDFAAHLEPPLTTVRIDGARIGRTAAQCLVDRIEGRAVAEPVVDVGFSVIARGTT